MAEYTEDLALIVRYDGTKDAFDDVKNNYLGKVVFIYGSKAEVTNQAGLVQAIWVSDANGGRYLDMANVDTIKEGMTHIAGLAEDGTVTPLDDGANGINFKGANGISIKISKSNTADGNGVPYWNVEVNGETLKSSLIGTSDNNSNTTTHPDTIKGAKAYTDKVAGDLKGTKADGDTTAETIRGAKDYADAKISDAKAELKGTKADGDTTAETIRGAKDYADKVAASKASAAKTEAIQESKNYVNTELAGKADLENGKIPVGQLPDYILGQMLFGGTIESGTATQMTVTPTANLLNKIGKTDSDLTNGNLTITNTSYETYEGVYFISSINFGNTNVLNIPDVRIGDWIISTGTSWRKVDNTDAVSSVAGLTGVITASDLAKKLAETGDANELALKSEVDEKYSLPDGGIPETDLAGAVVAKINKGNTSVQSVSGGDFISVTDTSVTTNSKSYEVSAKTKTMETAKADILLNGEDALATAHDVYNFIKARLSVKVVS